MTMPANERRRNEHLSDADLNDLIDGTLAMEAAATARAHLATCSDCEERYLTLMATVAALQHAPSLLPRRSFQLTPEQAKIPPKAPTWIDRVTQRIVPGLPAIRAATLAVAVLLISVTAFDVFTHQNSSPGQPSTTQMRQLEQTVPAPPGEVSDQSEAPVPPLATGAPLLGESNEAMTSASSTDGAASGGLQSVSGKGAAESAADNAGPAVAPAPASVASAAATEILTTMVVEETVATPLASPEATASPVPSSVSETSGGGASISRWRIAELALLLVLVWLAVSWVGRSHVENPISPDAE